MFPPYTIFDKSCLTPAHNIWQVVFDTSLECHSVFIHIEWSHILTGKRNATIEVITPKIYNAELWFLCMTHRLIVLYNCMKFHLNSFNGCQLTERTRNSIANDQRESTPKYPKQSYGFCAWHIVSLCSTSVWSFNQIALTVFNLQSGHDKSNNTQNISGFTYFARDPMGSWFHEQTKNWIYFLNIYISTANP